MVKRYAWFSLWGWLGAIVMAPTAQAQYQLSAEFTPNPLSVSGRSGGSQYTSDCGYLTATPNFTLTVTEAIPNLQVTVEAQTDVTLVVETPNGRLCLDDVAGLLPQWSGTWDSGNYFIWVGDWGQSSDFTLSIFRAESPEEMP